MKSLAMFLISLTFSIVLLGQGSLKESLSFNSRILNKAVKYSIYLPAGYENASRAFPVLYLLHGYTDNETGWTQFGEVERIANQSMSSGEASPMIIVMPDAGVSWYINDYGGKTKFEDFFIKEFIPFIDSLYKTRERKEFRAIAGLSMGGYGSLIMATKHPEIFSVCAPLSGAVFTEEEVTGMPNRNWAPVFGELFGSKDSGKARLNDHYRKNSILDIVKTGDIDKLKSVRYYIDCGDDDFLIKGNMALHNAMIDKKIPHEFRVRDGGHTWSYWRTALPEVLKFVTESFHR